jgi:hypothetical protein
MVESTGYVGEEPLYFHDHPDGEPGSSYCAIRLFSFVILTIGFAILARIIPLRKLQLIESYVKLCVAYILLNNHG